MTEWKKILFVGTFSAGKTTLVDALVGRKVLSGKGISEITCVYNEDAFVTPPVIDNCDRYVGVKLSSNISKLPICFIDTPGWDDIHVLERLIKRNQINTILFVINSSHLYSEYDKDLALLLSGISGIKIIFCLTRCDDCDPEDDIVQFIDWCKKTLKDMLKEEQIHNPTILTISPLTALLVKRKNNGEKLSGFSKILLYNFMELNEYPEFHLEKYCDNTIECQGDELLKHTGILNLETLLYEEC